MSNFELFLLFLYFYTNSLEKISFDEQEEFWSLFAVDVRRQTLATSTQRGESDELIPDALDTTETEHRSGVETDLFSLVVKTFVVGGDDDDDVVGDVSSSFDVS